MASVSGDYRDDDQQMQWNALVAGRLHARPARRPRPLRSSRFRRWASSTSLFGRLGEWDHDQSRRCALLVSSVSPTSTMSPFR